jgi:hypothetical protein
VIRPDGYIGARAALSDRATIDPISGASSPAVVVDQAV